MQNARKQCGSKEMVWDENRSKVEFAQYEDTHNRCKQGLRGQKTSAARAWVTARHDYTTVHPLCTYRGHLDSQMDGQDKQVSINFPVSSPPPQVAYKQIN